MQRTKDIMKRMIWAILLMLTALTLTVCPAMAEEQTEMVEEAQPETEDQTDASAEPEATEAPASTEPDVSFSRDFSSRYAESGDTVALSYTIRNNGALPIENIEVYDELIGEVGWIEKLEPGDRKVLSVRVKVTENSVSEPSIAYDCGGEHYAEGRPAETIYLADVSLRAELDADKTNVAPGEVVTLRLKLINEGSVNLYGLRASEPVLGEMGSVVSMLPPGDECVVTRTVQMKSTGNFQFSVNGSSDTGSALSVQSNEMSVLVTPVAAEIQLTLHAEADQTELDEPGVVNFSLRMVNECALELRNVLLSEETQGEIRNLMFVPSGEMPPIAQSYEVRESGVYRFMAQVTDSVGDELTVYSEPIEITVLKTEPEVTEAPTLPEQTESPPRETTIPVREGASYRMEENPATFEKLMIGTSLLLMSILFIWYVVAKFKRHSARRRKARQRRKQKKNKRVNAKK